MGCEVSPTRALNLLNILQLLSLVFTYFVKFHIVSLGQCSSKHIRMWPISYVRHLLSLCCRHRRTEHSALKEQIAGVTVEEIKKLRNIVATDSAGSSEMTFHSLPTTYSLVPVDNQVAGIDEFQLFRNGGFFI